MKRLLTGRTALADSDEVVGLAAVATRVVTLPIVTAFDYLAWPVVRRTLGRGPWWVVELRFHGPDAEFVRIAEASDHADALAKLESLS